MKSLFLVWKNTSNNAWYPIGRLRFEVGEYQFYYVNGFLEAMVKCGLQALTSFPDFSKLYTSQKLFPLFSNRVLSRSRPDYPEFVQWLNIPQHEDDPIALLARSGGKRVTDNFEVFPCPEPDGNGRYCIYFLAQGLQQLPPSAIDKVNKLHTGELLYLLSDTTAVSLWTKDGGKVGECPCYVLNFRELVRVEVDRLNQPPTPLQFRLLCKMTLEGHSQPFQGWKYQPVKKQYG